MENEAEDVEKGSARGSFKSASESRGERSATGSVASLGKQPSEKGTTENAEGCLIPSPQHESDTQNQNEIDAGLRTSIVDSSLRPEVSSALAALNMRTVTGRLQREWITEAEKEVLVFYDDEEVRINFTNAQMKEKVEGCSSLLRCNGVRKGDIVCNALDISPERDVVNFAIILCGAVLMDGLCIVDEGQRFWVPLQKANVKHLVVDPNDESSMAWKMVAHDVENSYADIERATLKELPGLEKIFKFRMQHLMKLKGEQALGEKSCFDLIDQHGATFVEIVNSYDPAVIFIRRTVAEGIYKMVLRTHIAVIQLAQRAQEMLQLTKDDVVYCDWPVSWTSGFTLCYITTGFTMVKTTLHNCPAQRVVRETWNVLEQEMCTAASLEPPMIVMLASHCEDLPKGHWLLRIITTSGHVKPPVMDAIGEVTTSVINCYSVIEAGLVSRLVVTKETKNRFSQGCVGELSDPHRTKLDIHGAGAVKPSKVGEIVLRGKLVCKQYYNDNALTQSAVGADGYLKTGDLGFYDSQSNSPFHDMLFVLGRKSQAIIRGDTAIFPRDIEEKVNQCPGIWKVSIVSIRDDKGVIQMCACVIPRSQDSVTIERVKEFCRYMLGGTADEDDNPHMPTYVFFFTDFPMLGKEVDKHTLAHTTAAVISGTDNIDS
ncbi:acyl-CoA synthetase family member 2, mitochondrial [Elysia marginata]|uniref:Medium-chain acyl-CoA ligase ACSF2, mitochondrial n=1 Tax=Elysia marginata TaxID=1093978 RepID=A0AAV4IWG4_9GAST|nr:acyl-CoA synthetase family member 2, mitochondrial [Elysia marginata]